MAGGVVEMGPWLLLLLLLLALLAMFSVQTIC